MTLSPLPVSPPEFHTTVYPVSNQAIMDAAQELVAGLKSRKYYTDTANFDLKCGVCGVGLKGEKGAREHAMQTGRELWRLAVADKQMLSLASTELCIYNISLQREP